MMRMDTLDAVFMFSGIKPGSSSGKNKRSSSDVDSIGLKGIFTANNYEESVSGKNRLDTSVFPQNKNNTNPINSQSVLKNLSCTDKAKQSHKSLNERTLVTSQNNNVESLPSIYFTRPTCGNTYTTKAPKRCGISMTNGIKTVYISY